jgi:hypothetical protein
MLPRSSDHTAGSGCRNSCIWYTKLPRRTTALCEFTPSRTALPLGRHRAPARTPAYEMQDTVPFCRRQAARMRGADAASPVFGTQDSLPRRPRALRLRPQPSPQVVDARLQLGDAGLGDGRSAADATKLGVD